MSHFKDFLQNNYAAQKLVETENPKNQEFICNSTKSWTNRHTGTNFAERNKLNSNQILFADFGFCYTPELAYAHPGLLLKYDNRLCKILPITSNARIVGSAYHPVINPAGNKSYYLIPLGTCNLTRDSAIHVTQLRTISESRIISIIDEKGLSLSEYENIKLATFKDCFNDFYHKIGILESEIARLQAEIIAISEKTP